ncbi:MAG: glutamate decarboxylase [Caloramator sp.]|nr:glutamate decarboxylase [Caloramator sp.]
MWTVVYVAQSIEERDKIQKALCEQGVLVKIKKIGKKNDDNGLYEILVPQTEVDDAYIILTSIIY